MLRIIRLYDLWEFIIRLGVPLLPFLAWVFGWFETLSSQEQMLWFFGLTALFLCFSVVLVKIFDFINDRFFTKSYCQEFLFEASKVQLPNVAQYSGSVNVLPIFYMPESPEFKSIGVTQRQIKENQKLEWGGSKTAIKFIVKNFSDEKAYNIRAKIRADFRPIIQEGKDSKKTGNAIAEHDYEVFIPLLKANGENEYEFYVYNEGHYFSVIAPEQFIKVGKIGSSKNKKVLISYTSGGCMNVPLSLWPEKEYGVVG